jgi:dTDP-4-dehydrorhamnose 3,5-epimerase
MIFEPLGIDGAYVLKPERIEDERGFFARLFSIEEFVGRGLDHTWVQASVSFNKRPATLRGIHYQAAPHEETKLVRCTRGAIYDVVVDLRSGSPTYLKWRAVELSESNRWALYVPRGMGHGFQTMTEESEVFYLMSECYHPESARTIRWDDPAFAIEWPLAPPRIISDKDRSAKDFQP